MPSVHSRGSLPTAPRRTQTKATLHTAVPSIPERGGQGHRSPEDGNRGCSNAGPPARARGFQEMITPDTDPPQVDLTAPCRTPRASKAGPRGGPRVAEAPGTLASLLLGVQGEDPGTCCGLRPRLSQSPGRRQGSGGHSGLLLLPASLGFIFAGRGEAHPNCTLWAPPLRPKHSHLCNLTTTEGPVTHLGA